MQVGADDQAAVEQWVRGAQKGDAASFAALYERFFDRIMRYVSFKSGSLTEAEDITGDVFVKMIESINSFKWQGQVDQPHVSMVSPAVLAAAGARDVPAQSGSPGRFPGPPSDKILSDLTVPGCYTQHQRTFSTLGLIVTIGFALPGVVRNG